jgi:predicted nucleic acid-binding protein
MTLVVDSSVALAWVLVDERHDATDRLLRQVTSSSAWVPAIWHIEVANALRNSVRRKRISQNDADGSLADLAALTLHLDGETADRAWSDTRRLSDRYGLTLYDAAYLELAVRRTLPLATLDDDLRLAAADAGVPLLGR